jgi:hypothetical protein
MKALKFQLIFPILLLIISACKKKKAEEVLPPISTTPVIELAAVAPTSVHAFSDSIVFNVKYTDGDGDIGDFNADSLSLVLTDNRNSNLVEKYPIAAAAPANVKVAVQGIYRIVLNHTILLNSSNASETTTFSVQLKDRAGNWSNKVTSETITVTN